MLLAPLVRGAADAGLPRLGVVPLPLRRRHVVGARTMGTRGKGGDEPRWDVGYEVTFGIRPSRK
jgi:hypothetical protein